MQDIKQMLKKKSEASLMFVIKQKKNIKITERNTYSLVYNVVI